MATAEALTREKVEGRDAIVVRLNDNFEPDSDGTLIKIHFLDGDEIRWARLQEADARTRE
jgi:hypothetical protein